MGRTVPFVLDAPFRCDNTPHPEAGEAPTTLTNVNTPVDG